MNVLVTGGCGYIGSHVCKLLKKKGHTVVVVDNQIRGWADVSNWATLYVASTFDQGKIAEILRHEKIDVVMHFAAYAYVGESNEKPDIYYENNVAGTISLLNAMRAAGINQLVFSSTCATYGELPPGTAIHEEMPQNPINPYGWSKLMCERIIRDYCAVYGFTAVVFRYFNAAGADPELKLGEDHDPETHIIPLTIKAALDPARKLVINGSDYLTQDGTAVRDYIHVSDIAEAHVLGLEYGNQQPGFSAFNLGNQRGFSILEIIQSVERLTGKKIDFSFGPRRPGDPAVLVGDNAKAGKVLGWKPLIKELDAILRTAIDWELKKGSYAQGV